MPKVIKILANNNIETMTTEDKYIFVQLLVPEFLGDFRNVITDEKASAKLLYSL